ncbi:MAG: DUF1565 domain-containing protein, partial [Acidobacteriota bacterium]
MLTTLRSTFVRALLLLSTATASAATLNVGPGQIYTTIQSAINAAANGDTVLVAPGTYFENLMIDGKEITLRSTAGAATTIIDGAQRGIVLTIEHTTSLATTVDGFTIRNGNSNYTPSDAGIYLGEAGATLQNNVFTGNFGYDINATLSSIHATNNQISTVVPVSQA